VTERTATNTTAFGADDRSVSEVLGYIIIFGLVITSVGIVLVSGTGSLEDVRDFEQASNAERAFDVVGDNMAAIYERNAPSRSTEIDLGDSEIYYGDPITINVTVNGEEFVRDIRPVVLRVGDGTSLVYEGGAMFREERDDGVVLRGAPFLFTEDRVHAPIIQTTAPAVESAGSTTILLRGKSTDRSVLHSETTFSETVNVTVESPRYELWAEYFIDETGFEEGDCEVRDDEESVECTIDPDLVYVTQQRIEVSLIL